MKIYVVFGFGGVSLEAINDPPKNGFCVPLQTEALLWRARDVIIFVENRKAVVLCSWAFITSGGTLSLVPCSYPDVPPSNANSSVRLSPWLQRSIKVRYAWLCCFFLVVLCLLHSFPIFYACFHMTLIDITVAEFGHTAREAQICSSFCIQ